MRKRLLIVLVCGAMMLAPGLVSPAHASHAWLAIGTAFRIGPAFISVVLAPPGYDYPYFYRFDQPLYYSGAGCGPDCFFEDGYYYYPSTCPLVSAYFGRYGVDPYQIYVRYAPRYYGRGYNGYDGYGSYGYYGGRSYDRYYGNRGTYRNRGYYNYDRNYNYNRNYDYNRNYNRNYDRRFDRGHDRRFDEHRDRRDDGRRRHDRDDHRGHDRDHHHRGHGHY